MVKGVQKMEREIPVYKVHETDFYVDVFKHELREKSNPENIISVNDMRFEGGVYSFGFDILSKNLPDWSSERRNIIQATIPMLCSIDPEGMAVKYNKPLEYVKANTDFEIIVDQDLYKRRLAGELPVMDIMDWPFYVDERLGSLRPKDDFSTMGLKFREMDEINDKGDYVFAYKPSSHQIAFPDYENMTEVPKDVFLIQIPNEMDSDPIGFARNNGLDIKSFALQHPPQRDLKATVLQFGDQPGLTELIEKNRKRLGISDENSGQKPIAAKKKRGRHL